MPNRRNRKHPGILIAKRLKEMDRTQTWLAARLGLKSSSSVTNWIKRTNHPSARHMPQIASALGVSIGDLYGAG